MTVWIKKVKIKHLFIEEEDFESIQKAMNDIADILEKEPCFDRFNKKKFRSIPKGDEFFKPVDYANKLLNRLYDFADENKIWIE